jgi:hypothetical protein
MRATNHGGKAAVVASSEGSPLQRDWGAPQVAQWLRSMHYESAAKLAEAKQIGGKVLASMTRESLAAALKLGPLQASPLLTHSAITPNQSL